ncbi:hypothetical protein NMG60_11008201 [Bertholletia excelsa]
MAGVDGIEAARRLLRSSLEKSKNVGSEMDKIGPRLDQSKQRLPLLEASAKAIGRGCSLLPIREHISQALAPASAVLKVFDVVLNLEEMVSDDDPGYDLFHYLSLVKKLEEALRLLTHNSGLVNHWLEEALEFLEENAVDDDFYLVNTRKSLAILGELQALDERSRLNGGLLFSALEKLEAEFRQLLTEYSLPMSFGFNSEPSFPPPVLQKLHAIIERLNSNHRIGRCFSIYAEVRISNARATLQDLDLDYLEITLTEFQSVQSMEDQIEQWGTHLEFYVNHLFEHEYRLCNEVFQKVGSEVWLSSFAEIALKSGMQDLIKFGNTVTNGKKDAVKLLKLLEIFAALNKQRLNFNRLFRGKPCSEIRNQTRDLIKKVVDGACEIFWELSSQVELQRQSSPPLDSGVPRLVGFVTDYCNKMLEDNYKEVLLQVLEIHHGWNYKKFEEEVLSKEMHTVINAIEVNLESWAKKYDDTSQAHLFLMNGHWFLYKSLEGSRLGDLMGDSWLRGHEQAVNYHAAAYLRESWTKLPAILAKEGLVKKKVVKEFSEAFDDMYKKQLNWVVVDKSLRAKTCQLVVETIVPTYNSFLKGYEILGEQGGSPGKYMKYSGESLENMLLSLFQPRLGKFGSTKCTYLIGKIRSVVANHFSSTTAAA